VWLDLWLLLFRLQFKDVLKLHEDLPHLKQASKVR
jgi:hypothetical protein